TIGHDWGGVVSLGWAVRNQARLRGVILTNTAIYHEGRLPSALRLATLPRVKEWATRTSSAFLRTTLALANPPLPAKVREAYLAPYDRPDLREGIADFVTDIPATPEHPSHPALETIAAGVTGLTAPVLIMWGPRDPVFRGSHLRDLIRRLPHADVHRFEGAGHLVVEDADVAGTALEWLERRLAHPAASSAANPPQLDDAPPVTRVLQGAADLVSPAVISLRGDRRDVLSWSQLARRVGHLALGLDALGVKRGDRISLLVPPGTELTTALFACLRLGAVAVVADQGLGMAGMSRAIRGAHPDVIIGVDRGLLAARALGWPGRRISLTPGKTAALQAETSLAELIELGRTRMAAGHRLGPEPGPHDDAAVLFTSGSTGPAKGVVYTHGRLAAMCRTLADTYGLGPGSAFVAGFAPFALLGTALGAVAIVPDMEVTAPGTLTARALAQAVAAGEATAVFTAPAALRNVLATAGDLSPGDRIALQRVELFLSAGAPVAPELLRQVGEVMPNARAHTPYGMTEVLPVTDVSLAQIDEALRDAEAGMLGAGGGTCVGWPVVGARVRVAPLDEAGQASGEPTSEAGITGEVLVTAPHLKKTYDRLWLTQARSSDHDGWHRTGDVGHLDEAGRLWIEGRLSHIITSPLGVLTPVALEHRAISVRGVEQAAAVGVGPEGTQQLVVVVETDPGMDARATHRPSLASPGLTRAIRRALGVPVAAVLRVAQLPTDVRHNTKIDRTAVAQWAQGFLSGERGGAAP
ncbi:MAG TPA: alpha/beta fold hydrolase, partial [Actinomycetaceae bacterium]|nr:alpha/beta fold hydrolase [Actinomycetaceae bacterium]